MLKPLLEIAEAVPSRLLPSLVVLRGPRGVGKTYALQLLYQRLQQLHQGYWGPGLLPSWPPETLTAVERQRHRIVPDDKMRHEDEEPGFFWLAADAADESAANDLAEDIARQLHSILRRYARTDSRGRSIGLAFKVALGQAWQPLQYAYDAIDLLRGAAELASRSPRWSAVRNDRVQQALRRFRGACAALNLPARPAVLLIENAEYLTPDLAELLTTFAPPLSSTTLEGRRAITETSPLAFMVVLSTAEHRVSRDMSTLRTWTDQFRALGLPHQEIQLAPLPRRTVAQLASAATHDLSADARDRLIAKLAPLDGPTATPLELARALGQIRSSWLPTRGHPAWTTDQIDVVLRRSGDGAQDRLEAVRSEPAGLVGATVMTELAPFGPKLPAQLLQVLLTDLGYPQSIAEVIDVLVEWNVLTPAAVDRGTRALYINAELQVRLAREYPPSEVGWSAVSGLLGQWAQTMITEAAAFNYDLTRGWFRSVLTRPALGADANFIANSLRKLPRVRRLVPLLERLLRAEGAASPRLSYEEMRAPITDIGDTEFLLDVLFALLKDDFVAIAAHPGPFTLATSRLDPEEADALNAVLAGAWTEPTATSFVGDSRWYDAVRTATHVHGVATARPTDLILADALRNDLSTAMALSKAFEAVDRFDDAEQVLAWMAQSHWSAARRMSRALRRRGAGAEADEVLAAWIGRSAEAARDYVVEFVTANPEQAQGFLDHGEGRLLRDRYPSVEKWSIEHYPPIESLRQRTFPFSEVKALLGTGAAAEAVKLVRGAKIEKGGEACLAADVLISAEGLGAVDEAAQILRDVQDNHVSVRGRRTGLLLLRQLQSIPPVKKEKTQSDLIHLLVAMQLLVSRSPDLELTLWEQARRVEAQFARQSWSQPTVWIFVAGRIGTIARASDWNELTASQWRADIREIVQRIWTPDEYEQVSAALTGHLFRYLRDPAAVVPALLPFQTLSIYEVLTVLHGHHESLRRRLRQQVHRDIETGRTSRVHADSVLQWAHLSSIARPIASQDSDPDQPKTADKAP